MENTIILNPDYHLMNDKSRIVMFTKGTMMNESDVCSFIIHPVQAMILSFFTFDRSLDENLDLLSIFLSQSKESVFKMISPFIENDKPFKTKWQGQDIIFPRNVLINVDSNNNPNRVQIRLEELKCEEKVDLSTKRIFSAPSKFTLMLTNKCKTNCVYCYADKKHKVTEYLSTERILELIREAGSLNVSGINLIGGEIFLHKDWHLILSELVKYDIAPITLSTKIPITESIAKKIKKSGYKDNVQISLDTSSVPVLQKLLNVKGDYLSDIIEGMRWLDKYEIPFHVATILTKSNTDEEQMKNLSELLSGFSYLNAWDIRVAINSLHIDEKEFARVKTDLHSLRNVYEYVKREIEPNVKYQIKYGNELMGRSFYKCEAGKSFGVICSALYSQMFVLPDGKVTICEQLYWDPRFIIGDLKSSSISEVWNSPKVMSLLNWRSENIQDKSPCRSCGFWEDCNGQFRRCWLDVQKAYGKENWDFPDPRCELAPKMKTYIGYI